MEQRHDGFHVGRGKDVQQNALDHHIVHHASSLKGIQLVWQLQNIVGTLKIT